MSSRRRQPGCIWLVLLLLPIFGSPPSGAHLLSPLMWRSFYPTQLAASVVASSPLGLVYLAPLVLLLPDRRGISPSAEKHRVHPKAFVIRDCLESELRPPARRSPRPLSLLKQSLGRVGGIFLLYCPALLWIGFARHHHRLRWLRGSLMLMPLKTLSQ